MNQIIGNPVPCKVGKKTYLVGYVSLGEWQVYRELLVQDEVEAMLVLMEYSLVRGGSVTGNIRRKVKRIIKKDPDSFVRIVDTIVKLSIPVTEKKKDDDEPIEDAKSFENNIKTSYRLLAKYFTWTPQQITTMSPAQIFISLTGGPECTGTLKQSWAEFGANRGLK